MKQLNGTKLSNYWGSELWIFLWYLRASKLRKVQSQEGHANLTPNGHSTHVHIWQPGRLMVPLCTPEHGIYRPFWFLPHSGEGVSYGQGWLPQKLGRQLRRGPLVPVQSPELQEQRLQVQLLWTPEGQLWYSGSGGMATSFRWGWGRGHGGMWYSSPQEPIKTLCLWSCHS